jgi:putative membrane protein
MLYDHCGNWTDRRLLPWRSNHADEDSMHLSNEQARQVDELTRSVEQNTGTEIVAAVVDKSDAYPEIPWKAFALGVTLAAMLLVVRMFIAGNWAAPAQTVLNMAFLLGAGAAAAAPTMFWPGYARLFLDRIRAEGEVAQYAKDLFLERELFATKDRNSLLVLISFFEHQVMILSDVGLRGSLGPDTLDKAIAQMAPALRMGDCFQSLTQGLKALEAVLLNAGLKGTAQVRNELPNQLIQQKGAGK